jgi:4-amino-4-deoxy-L-arabinose transferase-like glycosyltransferase
MIQPSIANANRVIFCLIGICIIIYILGWFIPLMEIDAAQYANISREMLRNKQFLQVHDLGRDYLDKPPMLFWLSALSMKIFGVSDFSYRLPSFFFAVLAIYSTYRFSLLFYKQEIAMLSALVLASCQAMFLITHDVKTDTMLMGWVMWSIWQLAAWFKNEKWENLILASVAIAGGLLTKGPIAMMIPIFVFLPHFILKRTFGQFFRWEYLVMLLIIAVLLIPMSWGLYEQFDRHPEKTMYGRQAVSGLRFFFWTQSFGRITGESTWHENDSFFFLFENMLWGFLPWILFFIIGICSEIRDLIKKKFLIGRNEEWICAGGFLVTYSALGMSKAQLPHYIYVVFPLAAIITAKWIYKLLSSPRLKKWINPLFIIHSVVFSLLWIALLLILIFVFPSSHHIPVFLWALSGISLIAVIASKRFALAPVIMLCAGSSMLINIFLDAFFYPRLLEYQTSIPVSRLIREQHLPVNRFYIYRLSEERSLHFYADHYFVHVDRVDSLKNGDYILTTKEGYDSVDHNRFKIIYAGEAFHVSMLTLPFLNPATRKSETTPYFVLEKN